MVFDKTLPLRRIGNKGRFISYTGLFLIFFILPLALSAKQAPEPDTVLVLANSASRDSMRVARDYLALRRIPDSNLIALPISSEESIDRSSFIERVFNPLLDTLLERKMIEAIVADNGPLGRKRVTVLSNPFRYLVICFGVPVHVQECDPIPEDATWRRNALSRYANLAPQFNEGPLAKNEASVDGELALILKRDQPLHGFVPNPFFNNRNPEGITDVLKVSRLDGPSARSTMQLTRRAIKAESSGLAGRAYVDEDTRQGAFAKANKWFQECAELFAQAGFDLSHDKLPATFSVTDRFDAPVLYAGWYARNISGPPSLDGFRFPDGAVAAHLHSFSASPLRSETKGWVGPLVHRGVTATFGNVAEPYLDFTHHFSAFFSALLNGWTFADAAYYAQPVLSWQNIVVGDPLYRPFNVSLEQQIEATGDPLNLLHDQYVFIRAINLAMREKKFAEAQSLADKGMRIAPGPALAFKQSQLLLQNGDEIAARRALTFIPSLPAMSPDSWGLLSTIADTLMDLDASEAALDIHRQLVNLHIQPQPLQAFLKRAIGAASESGMLELSTAWQNRLNHLESSTLPNPSKRN